MLTAILLAAAAPVPAPPAPPAPVVRTAPDPRLLSRARVLTELVNPRQMMIAANMRGWEAGITSSFKLDPAVGKLEAEYPGISKAGIDAARPLAVVYSEQFVDRASARKAALIAERLTAAEIDEAIRFYQGPVGRSVIRKLVANIDPKAIAAEAAQNFREGGKLNITQESADNAVRAASNKAIQDIAAKDQIEIMRHGQTSAARKLALIGQQTDREALEEANNPDPATVAKQQETISAAMIAFVDALRK